MQLIGYDLSSNHGPVNLSMLSINFLTGRAEYKDNINADNEMAEENAGGENAIYKTSIHRLKDKTPILLSEIEDFDNLDFDKQGAKMNYDY